MKKFLPLFNPFLAIGTLYDNFDLFGQMTKRNIANRYKGAVIGWLWSIIFPLLMLVIYTFVFSEVFKARWSTSGGESKGAFAVIMLCGLAVFNIFSETVSVCCNIITGNPNYVKKIIFPLEILIFSQVTAILVFDAVWFLILFVGAWLFVNSVSWTMLLLPIVLIPLILFSCGICFFVSSLNVYLKDTQHSVPIMLQILFFLTPLVYPLHAVPEKFQKIISLNPLALIVKQTRDIFIYSRVPELNGYLLTLLLALIVFQLGFFWFGKTKKGFADVL